jgi:hypothetical protein
MRSSRSRRTIVSDAAPAQLRVFASTGADTADRVAPEAVIIRSFGRRSIWHREQLFFENVRRRRLLDTERDLWSASCGICG